ncbi:hypothetical protein DFH07DRAFT_771761 [Mycena maculata]|uniref:Uncharacterized protein n=1 Tax=Mycena maculata TaxID=230809 RepID=A0AAD7NH93_9AGAR|nr:hypothetical protein DFH07DRAFT_771761 [Mycena maculata]
MNVIVDNRDALLQYSNGWLEISTQPAFADTTSSSVTLGDTANFTFTVGAPGSSVIVFAALGQLLDPPGNASSMLFSIDGGTPREYTPPATTGSSTTYHEPIWTSGPLAEESHTVFITQKSTSRQINLDYFLYNTTSSTEGKTISIDDNDASVQYFGYWSLQTNNDACFQHTVHLCASPGCLASLTFEGTSVTLQGPLAEGIVPNSYNVSVAIDGGPPTFISKSANTTSITYNNKLFFTSSPLPPGNHTIIFTAQNAKPFYVDYFLVGNDPSSAGVASTASGSSLSQSVPTSTLPSRITKSTRIPATVGGIVGGLALLLVVLSVAFVLRRRFQRRRLHPPGRAFHS